MIEHALAIISCFSAQTCHISHNCEKSNTMPCHYNSHIESKSWSIVSEACRSCWSNLRLIYCMSKRVGRVQGTISSTWTRFLAVWSLRLSSWQQLQRGKCLQQTEVLKSTSLKHFYSYSDTGESSEPVQNIS